MSSKATSDYRRRRKENLIKVCGNKCAICGYDKLPAALEFHHINPEEKKYGIASEGTCRDLETDLQEVQKCILVCANCHREIHYNLISLEEVQSKKYFDNDFANFLRQDKINKTTKKEYFCSECGKKISGDGVTGLCPECQHKKARIVERPNRAELKKLIRTTPFVQIGKKFNVSDNAIRKWCVAENLPSKSTEIKKYSDSEWEKI